MPYYDIAGLKVKMINPTGRTKKQAEKYLAEDQSEGQEVDITINIDEQRVAEAVAEHPELNSNDWEYMLSGGDFYTYLLLKKGILLHSSCVVVDGFAYAFSADSGVGKSTHTSLWMKHFDDRIYMLNDDKPAFRIIDDTVYACGTPWSGKHDYSTPAMVPLAGICFIERSETNWIKKADTRQAIFNTFAQTTRKLGPKGAELLVGVIEEIFAKVPIWQMGCNISDEAVTLAYDTMKPKKTIPAEKKTASENQNPELSNGEQQDDKQ